MWSSKLELELDLLSNLKLAEKLELARKNFPKTRCFIDSSIATQFSTDFTHTNFADTTKGTRVNNDFSDLLTRVLQVRMPTYQLINIDVFSAIETSIDRFWHACHVAILESIAKKIRRVSMHVSQIS